MKNFKFLVILFTGALTFFTWADEDFGKWDEEIEIRKTEKEELENAEVELPNEAGEKVMEQDHHLDVKTRSEKEEKTKDFWEKFHEDFID